MQDLSHIKHRNLLLPGVLMAAIIIVIALFFIVESDPCKAYEDPAIKDNCYLLELEKDWNPKWCERIKNEEVIKLCERKHMVEIRNAEAEERNRIRDSRSMKEKLLERKKKDELLKQLQGVANEDSKTQELYFDEDGVLRAKE